MASLYSALKRRRLAFSGTSGSAGLGMASGSTLAWGAVIVTVMSWEYSLSPSSVIDRGGVSQLMLAGRACAVSGAAIGWPPSDAMGPCCLQLERLRPSGLVVAPMRE